MSPDMAIKEGGVWDVIEWMFILISGFFWVGGLIDRKSLERVLNWAVGVIPVTAVVVLQTALSVDRFAGWWGNTRCGSCP